MGRDTLVTLYLLNLALITMKHITHFCWFESSHQCQLQLGWDLISFVYCCASGPRTVPGPKQDFDTYL